MNSKDLLVTDGECSFCQNAARWLAKKFPGNWENLPNNTIDISEYGLTKTEADHQVWYLIPNSNGYRKYGGAKAIAKLLLQQRKKWIKPFAILIFLPVISQISQVIYRLVANNRGKLDWMFKEPKTKVLLVGIDGLLLHRAIDSGRAKHLKQLRDSSFFVDMVVDMPTVSGPSWSTLLTGKRQEIHKVTDNYFKDHSLSNAPDFLTRARLKKPELVTYAAAGWPPLIDPNDVGPVIAEAGHIKFHNDGEKLGYLQVDKEVLDHALQTIAESKPDLSFIYFCGVDEAGHKYGSIDDPYFEAVERIDGYLAQIHSEISKHGEQWLLVVVTDHGHRDEGGHGGDSAQERASFVIAHGINREHPEWPKDLQPHDLADLLLQLID